MTARVERRPGGRRPRTETPAVSAPVAFGCAGLTLSESERGFFREAKPFGFILFRRNVDTPTQLIALVDALRDTVGWDAPVMIDQEGGRVARMGPPHWRKHPPVGQLCDRVDNPPAGQRPWEEERLWEALALRGRLIAEDLAGVGIDMVCAPALDLRLDGADPIVGDRALGADPARIASRGEALCAGFEAGGVTPVIKHIPGHGRARVDSHAALPIVEASRDELAADLAPFIALRDKPAAMTAHIIYTALDPERPATLSSTVIADVLRREVGFDGLLMSDDISMGALEGPIGQRAADSVAAGCDIALHCNGDLSEMQAIMQELGAMTPQALMRADALFARRLPPEPFDVAAARARLSALEAEAAAAEEEISLG